MVGFNNRIIIPKPVTTCRVLIKHNKSVTNYFSAVEKYNAHLATCNIPMVRHEGTITTKRQCVVFTTNFKSPVNHKNAVVATCNVQVNTFNTEMVCH